ncbi:hypothetical protein SteCoe_21386 [Stentor coeruleus]|uniref:HECT domain-containing protein n=1 Tax=Stentor coeruleus TaxID=5963 RepID=A0A1R2BPL8_9CILI|nr:hypothetical protein SteCoe_21386 [Stentor coeruleus]
MRKVGSVFEPVINDNNFFDLFFNKKQIKNIFVKKNTKFMCYIVADKEYEIYVKNKKNAVVESEMEKIEEKSEWDGLSVYRLSFEAKDEGIYFITHQGYLVPSDFTLSVKKDIPVIVKLKYSKLSLSFELTFSNCKNLYSVLYESTPKSFIFKNKILNIDLTSNNQPISFKKNLTNNSLQIFPSRPLKPTYIMIVTLDSIHVQGSPIKVTLADSFYARYTNFINLQQKNSSYFETLNLILVNQDLSKVYMKYFKSIRLEKIVAMIKTTNKNKKNLKPLNFLNATKNFLLNPNTKIFKNFDGMYQLEKNVDSSMLYCLSNIFANAIIHMEDLPLQLHPRLFLKCSDLKILKKSQLAIKLEVLKQLSSEELENKNLNFTVEDKGEIIPLFPNGENTKVTSENLNDYIQRTANWEYYNCSSDSIKSFQECFEQLYLNFTKKELYRIFIEGPKLRVEILKNKIRCHSSMNFQKNLIINWLSKKSSEDFANFLKFVTGFPYINFLKFNWHINLKKLQKCPPFLYRSKMILPYRFELKKRIRIYQIELPKADISSNTLCFPNITNENSIDILMKIAYEENTKNN